MDCDRQLPENRVSQLDVAISLSVITRGEDVRLGAATAELRSSSPASDTPEIRNLIPVLEAGNDAPLFLKDGNAFSAAHVSSSRFTKRTEMPSASARSISRRIPPVTVPP